MNKGPDELAQCLPACIDRRDKTRESALNLAWILVQRLLLTNIGYRPDGKQGRTEEKVRNKGIAEKKPRWREARQADRERHPQTVESARICGDGEPTNSIGDEVKKNPPRKKAREYASERVDRTRRHSTTYGNDDSEGNPCGRLTESECGITKNRRQQQVRDKKSAQRHTPSHPTGQQKPSTECDSRQRRKIRPICQNRGVQNTKSSQKNNANAGHQNGRLAR